VYTHFNPTKWNKQRLQETTWTTWCQHWWRSRKEALQSTVATVIFRMWSMKWTWQWCTQPRVLHGAMLWVWNFKGIESMQIVTQQGLVKNTRLVVKVHQGLVAKMVKWCHWNISLQTLLWSLEISTRAWLKWQEGWEKKMKMRSPMGSWRALECWYLGEKRCVVNKWWQSYKAMWAVCKCRWTFFSASQRHINWFICFCFAFSTKPLLLSYISVFHI